MNEPPSTGVIRVNFKYRKSNYFPNKQRRKNKDMEKFGKNSLMVENKLKSANLNFGFLKPGWGSPFFKIA